VALLSYQQIGISGSAVTYSAATATVGDAVTPDDRGFVHVKNGSGASITATLVIPGSLYGVARPDVAVTVPAGSDRFIGPMNTDFADPADGQVDVICSAVTSVTVAAVRV
jgi:hypothetical protein